MARVRPIKTNFTNGEVDPLITMRSDLELFVNGASLMRNVLPFPQGGFRRRDGLETMIKIPPSGASPIGLSNITIAAGGSSYVAGTLLSVSGGTTSGVAQARITKVSSGVITELEMTSIGAYTVVPSSPASTSGGGGGSGATVTFTADPQDVIKLIEFGFSISQNYILALTVGRWYVFRKEDTGSGPNQLVEAHTDGVYDNQQLNEITWTQSLDVMIVFHNELPMRKLIRVSETNWTFEEFFPANIPTEAFGVLQTVDLTVTYGSPVVGDTRTVTASAAAFVAANVGDYIRISAVSDGEGNNFGSYLKITAYTSTTVVTGEFLVLPIIPLTTATYRVGGADWLLEELAFSPEHGYPRCGEFYQGRLITGATTDRPQTMYTSRAGDINDFNSGGAADDLGIIARLDSGERTTIQNINGGRHLQLFTDNAEYYVPISEGAAITPSNIAFRLTSSVGSVAGIPVFNVDGLVYFTQRGGQSFRSFEFVDGEKAYDSLIVSLFSSHLIRNPIDAAFKKSLNTEKGNYIWVVNQDDFSLTTFSVLKSELINAWSLQTTQGKFKGVAVSDQDSYFHVTRNPGGTIDYSTFFRELTTSQGSNSNPQGVALSADGTKMFVVSDQTDTVYEYALNFTESLKRVVYTGNSFDLSGETAAPKDVVISPDGLKMFIIDQGSNLILEYDMTEPNSLAEGNVTDSGFTMDFSSAGTDGTGFDFSPDGLNIIFSDATEEKVFLFTATTAFTFEDGTTDTGKEFDISSEGTNSQDAKWSADGLRFFVVDGTNENIFQYSMTTAFDVSTASYTGDSFFTGDQDSTPYGMTFGADGLTIMIAGITTDSIYEYDLSNPFQFGERTDWIEFFQTGLMFDAAVAEFSGITTPVTEISGQTQLANETVGIIIDDVIYENQVVDASGDMTFPIEAHYNYQIGLPFPNILIKDENNEDVDTGFNVLVRSLPADILLPEGSAMGQKKRVPSATVRYVDTQGFYLQEIFVPFRNLPDVLDRPIPLQTEEQTLDGLLGWDDFGYVTIGQKEPLAMTILGWAYDLSTGA